MWRYSMAPSRKLAMERRLWSSSRWQLHSTAQTEVKVANRKEAKAEFLESAICRVYFFSEKQMEVLKDLKLSMQSCGMAFGVVAAANVLLSLVQTSHPQEETTVLFQGLTVGDVAYWADSLLVAFLVNLGVQPFAKVVAGGTSNQMAYVFQGINRMGLIFQQLAIGSFAVSTVTVLEAAAKYPKLIVGASVAFFGIAVVRSLAMWWVVVQHTSSMEEVEVTLGRMRECKEYAANQPLLDRLAISLAFGYLLNYEPPRLPGAAQSVASMEDPDGTHYEFNLQEERLLKSMVESANTAGLALGLQAFATFMLVVAETANEDWEGVVSNGINFVNKAIMTALVFNACTYFDRALHTEGSDDVEHLLDGLGSRGLTALFSNLGVLAWAVVLASAISLAAPSLEESPVFTAVSDITSHKTAHALIEALEYAAAFLKGL